MRHFFGNHTVAQKTGVRHSKNSSLGGSFHATHVETYEYMLVQMSVPRDPITLSDDDWGV